MARAFQLNAFQNNAFQILDAGSGMPPWDGGVYGPDEDEERKRILAEVAELQRLAREDRENDVRELREVVIDAVHYTPLGPPKPQGKPKRPPFLPPPAGPTDPWSLAKLLALGPQPQPPQPAPPPIMPPPDPLQEVMAQIMAEVDQVVAQLDSIDVDAMIEGDPEYQSVMQMLERL